VKNLTLWVFIFLLLYIVGQFSPTYGVDPETACLQAQLTYSKPAANILFVGNSAVGSAVDTQFVERELSLKTGRTVKVERLVNLGSNIMKYQLDLVAYAENRGWPDIVVLNLFNRLGKPEVYSNKSIFEIKSLKLHDWQALHKAKDDFYDNFRGAKPERLLNSTWYNDAELLLFKVTDSIYRSIKLLSSKIAAGQYCDETDGFTTKSRYQPHGQLKAGALYDNNNGLITPSPENLRAELEKSARFYPLDLDSVDRYMEFHQMREVISLAQGRGVRFYLTHVPVLSWRDMGPNSLQVIEKQVPEATYVDSYQMFAMPGAQRYADNAFRNINHLNFNGAHLFSSFWVNYLSEHLDD